MHNGKLKVALAGLALAAAIQSPVFAYQNGALPQSALAPIYCPGATDYLERDAAAAWNAMRAYCRARGTDIYPAGPNSAYRTVAQQKLMKKLYGSNAATPGTSNHGLGLAVDLASQDMRHAIDKWGAQFGWSKKWSDASWEWWHIKYKAGVWHGQDPGVNGSGPSAPDDAGLPPPAPPSNGGVSNAGTTPSDAGTGTSGTNGGATPSGPSSTGGLVSFLGEVEGRPQLSRGSNGQDVRDLQKALRLKGYDIDVDGDFGKDTENAVRAFQKKNKLGADGVVGPKTWKALAQH